MANLGFVTVDTGDSSVTSIRDALQSLGHTVTMVDEDSIEAHDFSGYDLVVASRASASVSAALRSLSDGGQPVILGDTQSSGSVLLSTAFGITGPGARTSVGEGEIVITDNSHPITSPLKEVAHQVRTGPPSLRGQALESGAPYVGEAIGTGDPDGDLAGLVTLLAVPAGTNDLSAAPLGSRVVFAPSITYGRLTNVGMLMLGRAVDWALGDDTVVGDAGASEVRTFAGDSLGSVPGDFFASALDATVEVAEHPVESTRLLRFTRAASNPPDTYAAWLGAGKLPARFWGAVSVYIHNDAGSNVHNNFILFQSTSALAEGYAIEFRGSASTIRFRRNGAEIGLDSKGLGGSGIDWIAEVQSEPGEGLVRFRLYRASDLRPAWQAEVPESSPLSGAFPAIAVDWNQFNAYPHAAGVNWIAYTTDGTDPLDSNERPSPPILGHEAVTYQAAVITRQSGGDPEDDPIVATRLQVATASDFSSGIVYDSGAGGEAPATVFPIAGLTPETQYWYRGADADAGGFGEWSTASTFTTEAGELGLAVTAVAVGGRAVITFDPEGSTNDFRLYRRPAPDGVGAGDWVLSAVIPGPVAEHLPYTDLTSSPCEEWEYTVREVEDGEEQPQYVPDTVAIPCLSADTISATLEGALLARIDVMSPSDTATQRTLQASASSDFASFVEIPQEGGPLPAVLYDMTGEAGARRYYRTAVTDGLSTAYSNVVHLDFPAEPGPAKPVLTVEAIGVNFVVVSLSAPAVPAGHTIAAIELAIYFDGDLVRNETIPIADPDDPDQPWREQAIEEIDPPEETFTVTGRWISDSTPDSDPTFSPGPYSDPKTFTLLDIPEEDPEEDDPEEAGQVEHLELSDEWPIPLYSLRLALTLPEIEHLSSVQVNVSRSGSHVRAQFAAARHPIRQFGAMLPGATYSFAALWTYIPPYSYPRRAASRVSSVTIPLANVPPYFKIEPGVSFTEPTTIEFDQHQHPSFEGYDVITEGAWPVEITRDGATWVRLTDDARIEPYEFDPASYTSGYAQFRVRNEPAEGAPSRWRTSPPVYLHPPEYFWRHAGDELTVDLFETGGSGEWSQVGEAEDRRVRYVGGKGTGGYAALKHVGQPRTFEVTTVGQWATGHAGHWMYGFHAEMLAHWGVGAFLRDDPYTALTARLGSTRAANGRWLDRHLGEAGAPWWEAGIRYGLGSMRPLIGRYGPASGADPGARTHQSSGSSVAQWLGGAASVVGVPLSPWYTVRARYTLLETELDGSHRIRVQMQFWGPDSDHSAGFSLSYEYRGIEWPCGPPGLLAVSGSNNVIDFQSITVLAEDYGTCPLPEGTDFLASASGSPCDPLIAIFWRHGHGGS